MSHIFIFAIDVSTSKSYFKENSRRHFLKLQLNGSPLQITLSVRSFDNCLLSLVQFPLSVHPDVRLSVIFYLCYSVYLQEITVIRHDMLYTGQA